MTNPLKDFSRLHTELPERMSERGLRYERRNTLKYFAKIEEGQLDWPKMKDYSPEITSYLSRVIDESALRVYNEAVRLIQKTPEHKANYLELKKAPKNCGGFKIENSMLSKATHFEQMVALDHVIDQEAHKWPVGRRTYAFSYDNNQVIPIYVASRKVCISTTMTTMLGAARGQYKAPKYDDLAASEDQAENSIFIKPLESLEYVRQPYFCGATILKANAFEVGIIDNNYRYATEFTDGTPYPLACVELVGQNKPAQAPIKERSAGSNFFYFMKHFPKERLVKSLNYDDWNDDGADPDVKTSFKVKHFAKVLKDTVESKESDDLDNLIRNLFVSRTGPFTSPTVNTFYAEKLFPDA